MDDLLAQQDFAIAKDLMETRVNDELVLLHPARGEYYGLDPIGLRVFEAVRANQHLKVLVLELSEEFQEPIEKIERDVNSLLLELIDHELIHLP